MKAREVLQHGYDALLFDLRSCGTSDGDRFTMGTEEPRDVLGAYDFMVARGYVPERMTVLAVSMGASSMIEAAPDMPRVGALIADSAFAASRPLIERELPHRSHLPGFLVNWSVITSARLLFGLNPDLRPVDVVRALPQRAFLVLHGTGDDFIPADDATQLFRASANPGSRIILLAAQGHSKEYLVDPGRYMAAVYSFIDEQVGQTPR